jgi:hypothetical protein
VATSTLRFAIIVALVIGGVVLIGQAFSPNPEASTIGAPTTSPSASPATSPTKTPKPKPTPTVAGVRIAVFNGTSVSGLAGDVTTQLQNKYDMVAAQDPADAPSPVAETTLYYRGRADQVEAEFLARKFFQDLPNVSVVRLEPGAEVGADVQVAIYLGNDYAALTG